MDDLEHIYKTLGEISQQLANITRELADLKIKDLKTDDFIAGLRRRVVELEKQAIAKGVDMVPEVEAASSVSLKPEPAPVAKSPDAPVTPTPAPPIEVTPPKPAVPIETKPAEPAPVYIPPVPKIPAPPPIDYSEKKPEVGEAITPSEKPKPPPLPKIPVPPRPEPAPILRTTPKPPQQPKPPKPPRPPMDWGAMEAKAAVWGTRVGAFIVVIGFAYLLSIGFNRLGPFGKAMVVYAACIGMWTTGVVFERLEKYTTWAKIMIAGGWGGVYITTFLIHYLPQARLIADPSIDVFLLMAISAGMITHSLTYKSEPLTTLTYFIAFITIALSIHLAHETYFSLIATAVLAISMLFILYRMQWYRLALFSLLACYGTHTVWLNPLISAFRSPEGQAGEFWAGLFMLILYWLTFTIAVFLTKPKDKKEEALGLWMVAVNYVSFMVVFRYHVGTAHPEWRWYFTAAMTVLYGALSYFAYSLKRKNLYTLNLVIAVLCATMTMYFKFLGSNWVAVAWLLQAEALYIAGLLGNEKRFRLLGIGNFIVAGLWLLAKDLDDPTMFQIMGMAFYKRTMVFATAAVIYYANALVRQGLARRVSEKDQFSFVFSYAASTLWLILMIRAWYPDDLLQASVVSAFLGFTLMEIGINRKNFHFRLQGLFFACAAVLSSLMPLTVDSANYYAQDIYYRIGCEAFVILFAYAIFARFRKLAISDETERRIEVAAALFSMVAAVIAVMLLYREFELRAPVWLALAWMVLGVLLVEVGISIDNMFFRIQGYLVTLLTMIWALHSFINRPEWFDNPTLQIVSIGMVVGGFFYLFWRVAVRSEGQSAAFSRAEKAEIWVGNGPLLAAAFSAAGSIILLLLIRQELMEKWWHFIAVGWLIAGVALLEAGIAVKNRFLRLQAVIVAALALVYAIHLSFTAGLPIAGIGRPLISVTICIALLYYLYWRAHRGEMAKVAWADLPMLTPVFSWSAAILMTLIIRHEVWPRWPAWVGTAWLAPMLAFAYMAQRRKDAHIILQGIVLSAVVFLWTLFITVANTHPTIAILVKGNRIYASAIIIAVFYLVFATLFARGLKLTGEHWGKLTAYARDAYSWAASILLVALVTVELGALHEALTSVVWIGLAVAFYEIGRGLKNTAFKSQGYLLACATFGRILIINLAHSYHKFLFTTQRTATVLAVAAGLYYLYLRVRRSGETSIAQVGEKQVGAILSYLGSASLTLLIYKEVFPQWVPPSWAGLLLGLSLAGILLGDAHLLYQALMLVLPIIIGVIGLNFPLHGTTECRVGAGLAIAGLFMARIIWEFGFYKRINRFDPAGTGLAFITNVSRNILQMTAAVLLVILITLECSGDMAKYLTISWACEGFLLMVLGFALKDRIPRFSGLALLGVCIIKVFYDLWVLQIDRIYKVIALIGLGVILIVIGWIYSRYRDLIKKLIAD